jgi:hypothetical protein
MLTQVDHAEGQIIQFAEFPGHVVVTVEHEAFLVDARGFLAQLDRSAFHGCTFLPGGKLTGQQEDQTDQKLP